MGGGHTTGSLARALDAQLVGSPDLPITSLETLALAGPGTLTFIRSGEFAAQWASSRAAAALVSRGVEVPGHDASRRALLIVADADLALIKTLRLFAPPPEKPAPGVHPAASVDPGAVLGAGVCIGPGCAVAAGARLGEGVRLMANVVIGRDASVGDGSVLHAGVTVMERCRIGRRCTLFPGVVIGADGFGYRPAPDGRGVVKVPHIGTVDVGDDVDIGANTCIDRGKFGATRIGDGTKIDNLVQIGHNCLVGRACLICGQAALAGSVTLGDGVMLGGQVGIADNVTIGAGTMLGAQSGVMNDIPAGQMYLGTPAGPRNETAKLWAAQRSLVEVLRRLKRESKSVGATRESP